MFVIDWLCGFKLYLLFILSMFLWILLNLLFPHLFILLNVKNGYKGNTGFENLTLLVCTIEKKNLILFVKHQSISINFSVPTVTETSFGEEGIWGVLQVLSLARVLPERILMTSLYKRRWAAKVMVPLFHLKQLFIKI